MSFLIHLCCGKPKSDMPETAGAQNHYNWDVYTKLGFKSLTCFLGPYLLGGLAGLTCTQFIDCHYSKLILYPRAKLDSCSCQTATPYFFRHYKQNTYVTVSILYTFE